MKHLNLFIVSLLFSMLSWAQVTPYNVVFDLTSKDTNDHKTVLRWMNALPDYMLSSYLPPNAINLRNL